MKRTRIRELTIWVPLAVWSAACGGDPEPPPEPPQVTTFTFTYAPGASCSAVLPTPNSVFVDADLRNEAGGCGLPGDPVEAAIARVLADDGAPLDLSIRLPFDGVEMQGASLTASAAFSLMTGTSSVGDLPPLLLFEQVGTATVPEGWRSLAFTAAVNETVVEVSPAAPLEPARRYVLIATDEIRNARGNRVEAADITKLLVGIAPIAAAAAEGVDAEAAVRLERARVELAPLVTLLARASPNVESTRIVAITSFTTRLGYERLVREIAAYKAAAARDRFDFSVSVVGGDLPPRDVDPRFQAACPPGRTVVGCYDRVRAFRRGTVRVPRVLDASGHLRPGWATTAIESNDMPFMASIPNDVPANGAPVTLMIPGFGRGRLDAREMANEFAGRINSIILAVELERHGERTVNPTTGMPDLVDERPNTPNMELPPPDGIPDHSGIGFLRADPRALRDSQIAAVIEVLHVIEALSRRTTFVSQGIEPDGRILNIVAHGYAAQTALHVAAFTPLVRVLMLPAGGVGIKELVSGGPPALKTGFLAGAPTGVTSANLDEYLTRLEQTVLQSVSIERSALTVVERLIRPNRQAPRVLLPHGDRATDVPLAARTRLVASLSLESSRVSQHRGACDTFYLAICMIGDVFERVVGAQTQMSTFASSGGVTVTAPAP